jgi:5-methylcytosine-specific restriction endonuclease McrA
MMCADIMTPFDKEKRKNLTARQKAQLFSKANGYCQNCGVKLRSGTRWEADHIQALVNQGTNELDNWQVLCEPCHTLKTKDDVGEAATNQRKFTKTFVPKRDKRGGFRGWRKFNGEIVWKK